jgi:cyclopropane-fatty-acyl-phospholipid synthase
MTAVEAQTAPQERQVESGPLLAHVRPRRLVKAFDRFARHLLVDRHGRKPGRGLEIAEGDEVHLLGDAPRARAVVHDARAYGAFLRSGSVGLGNSYVNGWWDADDLTSVVQTVFRRSRPVCDRLDALASVTAVRIVRDLLSRPAAPGRHRDRRNVAAHYDLSNEFFAHILDETMTYSCAVFERPEMGLAEAQLARIDRICRKLELGPEDHLLEIGSGWGQFALHAAANYGCRVTTTTISAAQRAVVDERITAAGLSRRVTVLGADWRDLTGTFDKLASIEMIEAVDWRHHDAFLAQCDRLLAADGLALIQAIVIDDRAFERAKHRTDFVREMVFPGSCIPSLSSISRSLSRATRLRLVDLEDIGRHYAETLRCWAVNLEEAADELGALGVDDELYRLFRLYLAYCEASFLERHVSDVQLVLARPEWRGELAVRRV